MYDPVIRIQLQLVEKCVSWPEAYWAMIRELRRVRRLERRKH